MGSGTTILWGKKNVKKTYGMDVSSLAYYVTKVKTQEYSKEDLEEAKRIANAKYEGGEVEWEFIVPPEKAFPRRNLREIMNIMAYLKQIQGKARELAMLALISILPMASLVVKDGGFLRYKKEKSAGPAKKLFRRKLKRMINELETIDRGNGNVLIKKGDARDDYEETFGTIFTSPPYLNNVDYTKIYGLEESLLFGNKVVEEDRKRMLRSFIQKKAKGQGKFPIVDEYFKDMELVLKRGYEALKSKGKYFMVVGNAVIHGEAIEVDLKLSEIAESIGFSVKDIYAVERKAHYERKSFRVRESLIIMEK